MTITLEIEFYWSLFLMKAIQKLESDLIEFRSRIDRLLLRSIALDVKAKISRKVKLDSDVNKIVKLKLSEHEAYLLYYSISHYHCSNDQDQRAYRSIMDQILPKLTL